MVNIYPTYFTHKVIKNDERAVTVGSPKKY